LILLLISVVPALSQQTFVHGKVSDRETNLPIPYISVVFKNTQIGTFTDSLGFFHLSSKQKADSIRFSGIGYISKTIAVKSAKENELEVMLKPVVVNISEIKVIPDEGPVRRIMKAMVDRKKDNNPEKYQRYSYRKYTKWEYHLMNVGNQIAQSKAFRNNQSVFKTDDNNSRNLPLYFSEQLVVSEVQGNPPKQKSTVLADKTYGVGVLDNYEISGYTSALDLEVNFYDNFITLYSQNFVSPLAENGWFYYKYFLADSLMRDGKKEYRINFYPRRPGDKTFKGFLITETKNYSLVEIDGTLSGESYVNFLKSLRLKQSFQFANDSIPFFRRNQIDAIFNYIPQNNNPKKKPISLFSTQSSVIDSVTVNQPEPVKMNTQNARFETIQLPDNKSRNELFWQNNRLEDLSSHELDITSTIDSVNDIKLIKVVNNLSEMMLTNYYDFGRWEFGPYPNVFNTNKVEGVHLFAGFRTSDEISTRYLFWGGLGYGFKNKKINGIAGVGYKFPTINRQLVKFAFDDKYVRSGENEKILFLYENMLSPTENNLISQVFKRDELDELFREQKVAATYEYEWYPGLMNKFSANYIRHFSPEYYPFLRSGKPVDEVSALDISIDTRFSWEEKVIDDKFLRIYMATDYPIVHFTLGGGKAFYSGMENYYGKVSTTVEQYLRLGQTAFNYALEGGIYFGKLPYTMLDIPRGNETYGLYTYDFNMLNFQEYVHDKYLHAYLEYHLNGFILNRIPVLKRIGLREVLSAKTMVGSVRNQHRDIVDFPVNIVAMSNPYIEVGAGLENIFRLFRIEAIWRIRPESSQGAPNFGIKAKFEIKL
jgi:hypothetical protein